MNSFFPTPDNIARALLAHAPRNIGRVLDPSVGDGALVLPLLERERARRPQLTAIDVSKRALSRFNAQLDEKARTFCTLVNADFLNWVPPVRLRTGYDLIVMNPPFCGRRQLFRQLQGDTSDTVHGAAPIEAAFLLKALTLLKSGGRLLALLPPSIISLESGRRYRNALLDAGSIVSVEELKPYSFVGVESRVYLVVFEKGGSRFPVSLSSQEHKFPNRVRLTAECIDRSLRMDFAYYQARAQIKRLYEADVSWVPLEALAEVKRGLHRMRPVPIACVHTNSGKGLFWTVPSRKCKCGMQISANVILMKRVGRDALDSAGLPLGRDKICASDCVLFVSPLDSKQRLELLFALRVLLGVRQLGRAIEAGTGAVFVRTSELRKILVPIGLARVFPHSFRNYKKAVLTRSVSSAMLIEEEVRANLMRNAGVLFDAASA